jgi:hypothetical protein
MRKKKKKRCYSTHSPETQTFRTTSGKTALCNLFVCNPSLKDHNDSWFTERRFFNCGGCTESNGNDELERMWMKAVGEGVVF